MKKSKEQSDPTSCWNQAGKDEILFVLLAHDRAAPATIRFWVGERLRSGKNRLEDAKIQEALQCANDMELSWGARQEKET